MRPRESVRIVADASALAMSAADLVVEHARNALAARGRFELALSGGSTPRGAYVELAHRARALDPAQWHVWFVDERCVPPDHPDSNFHLVESTGLLAALPAAHVHRMRGETRVPAEEAARYEAELSTTLGVPPRLDLALLGMGTDGHTASLFPATPALEATGWVTVGHAPVAPHARLTLTLPALRHARALVFLVAGREKRGPLRTVLSASSSALPAAHATPDTGTLLWLVDRAAGSEEPPG